jgi:hypothetical protein
MKDTDQKAKAGMSTFVATIAAIALLLAGLYFVFWTPGAPDEQPTPNAIDRSG